MLATKPHRLVAAAAACLLSSIATTTIVADELGWLPEDPTLRWSGQLLLNLELIEQNAAAPNRPVADPAVLDWVFWQDVKRGENDSLRSLPDRHLIHERAVFRGAAARELQQDEIRLTSSDDNAPTWDEEADAEEELVMAWADLPAGAYRVSVVLNDPPEAFHISAQTKDGVKIHEFIRDREARIKLVADDGSEIIAWRYSFAARVDQLRQVEIHIRRAAGGFVALDDQDSMGPMGIVVEELDGVCPCGGEEEPHSEEDPVLVVINADDPQIIQPWQAPIVYTGIDNGPYAGGGMPTPVPSPREPTIDPITLGAGGGVGGAGGRGPTTSTSPTTVVPESVGTAWWVLLLAAWARRKALQTGQARA